MFKELTFYLDSCDSSSMFPNLSASTENIYAMTATSDNEPACAVFCCGWAKLNGKNIGTCLSETFSISWMLDTEQSDPFVEMLSQQYATVSKRTTNSTVSQFGYLSFQDEPVGEF